jgi:diguanylate cyclase (GGDEF)-like protein/PAS domain S-box-containing protein
VDHLCEAMPDGILVVDVHGVVCHVNERVLVMTNYRRDELVGQAMDVLIPSRFRNVHRTHLGAYVQDPTVRAMSADREYALRCRDGSELEVYIALSPFVVADTAWTVATIRDDRLRRAMVRAQDEAEMRFELAFENNMAPMMFHDLDNRLIAVNDAFCLMIGRNREELLGRDSTSFTHPEDLGVTEATHKRLTSGEIENARYVKRYVHKDGRVLMVEVLKAPAVDAEGNVLYYVLSQRDITEERALTAQLSHQALHDPLTGLANRALFNDRLAQAMERAARHGGLGAVVLLDLDDFKGVNDTYGHVVGDQLLEAVARRLERATRSTDTLSRFGGDEFLYLADGLKSPDEADEVARRLLGVLAEPFSIAGRTQQVGASAGLVLWDGNRSTAAEVIQRVDVALYEAKRQGKGRFVTYAANMHEKARNRYALTHDLRDALHSGHLEMHYQPIIDLVTTEVVGFEALMRWPHPERGMIPPNVFIAIAEESELILEVGAFALREAIATASAWAVEGVLEAAPYVTVNLSTRQFHDPNLVPTVAEALTTFALQPERLVIEITESVTLLDLAETLSVIKRLDRLGVTIALDDFGTGFSSLSYLSLLQPKIIKIDQSFVSPAQPSAHNDVLLEAIISLGRNLNMTVIAEGIETREQLERLVQIGCDRGQGFLFSPAVQKNDLGPMLNNKGRSWTSPHFPPQLTLSSHS